MIIASKPLLKLQRLAFSALIDQIEKGRDNCFETDYFEDYSPEDIDKMIRDATSILDAVNAELKNKH